MTTVLAGALSVRAIIMFQLLWSRRLSPRTLGFRQLGLGITVLLITAFGVIVV